MRNPAAERDPANRPREASDRRVVGYLRVSTADQADRGYGLDVQRARIEEFCKGQGLELVAVLEDPGVSGTVPLAGRPGLSAALEFVKAEGVGALVVARFDRLARDTLQALLIEQELSRTDTGVLYAEGGANGDEHKFMRTVMHAMSEEQKRQLVARLSAARRAKKARGGYAGGRPAFGYRAHAGHLMPHPAEAEVVRWIFERVARDHWSVRRVTRALDDKRTLGRRWDPRTVSRILLREDYKRGPAGARVVDPKVFNRARAVLTERNPT